MSTAIALQDMSPHIKQRGRVHHQSISRSDSNASPCAQHEEACMNTGHAATSANLPDGPSFVPTNVYWISPHGLLTKQIPILDLTKDMEVPYTTFSDTFKNEVKKTLKDHSFTPAFVAHRQNWLGLTYHVTDNQGETIAGWKHSWTSVCDATLTFPENSPHSSHTITLQNKVWGLRTEAFTLNSVLHFWEMDSLWHSNYMTLYKVIGTGEGQKKIEVGKYAQKWYGGFVTGGTLVVNEKEIDGFVACMTLLVVLKKKRQRAAERKSPD